MKHERCVSVCSLPRSSSCQSTTSIIIPANYLTSSTFSFSPQTSDHPRDSSTALFHQYFSSTRRGVSHFLRSILSFISFRSLVLIPTCNSKWLTAVPTAHFRPSLGGRKVTGTLFGRRRGHVSFVVQDHPRSNSNLRPNPLLVIEFAVSTSTLVKEMSSGLVRIGLECDKMRSASSTRLLGEPVWSMYCNGKKCGQAVSRDCTESDWSMLNTVASISVGAGVIPAEDDVKKGGDCDHGELLYMRARFERVIGSRDSEAFYMLNPDRSAGGPELSIFFLRI